ncbi:heme ABC transporter ATP-binding protein [Tamilnaduibacter salinus]|uniref:Heme ABC transporter ATP-binding protein n=1 Tax=Tamilnaduibacter salinus TaxID=1484056 RepID=A0A2A2I0T0_9GAMM|nr:heme ABC transporter ATP-binding protein [Tamilnaduibacter salinus]PAV25631.1 heme ABC transporter ATP-binding protein [Tamilnaduibacter salinus]
MPDNLTPLQPQPAILETHSIAICLGGHPIVEDLSFTLRPGELVALLGPNGAGKSTLIRALAGEIDVPPDRVRFAGRAMGDWRRADIARHRAVMPQKVDLQFPMTTREVIALGRPRESAENRQRIIGELMARLDIARFADRLVPTLSGGEQQRVQLARVLAQIWERPAPHLLLLDECSSALDPAHQQLIFRELKQLAARGVALLVAVHDLNLASQFADRLMLLQSGRVVAEGTPGEVLVPDTLRDVYGLTCRVEALPEGYPMVIPTPESEFRANAPGRLRSMPTG